MLLERDADFQIYHVILIVEIILFVIHSFDQMIFYYVGIIYKNLVLIDLSISFKVPCDDRQCFFAFVLFYYLNNIVFLSFNDVYDFYFIIEVAVQKGQLLISFHFAKSKLNVLVFAFFTHFLFD